jgi:DNA mismatch repair protein MutS2
VALAREELKKGAKAWVSRFRAEAEIVEILPDGAKVMAGVLKAVVPFSELFSPGEAPPDARPFAKGRLSQSEATAVAIQTRDNTCDLRGLRTDDAVAMAVTFLDRALNDGLRVCFLVHGHGTGAIRDALRKELKESPYVAQYRPGTQHEGGDGATIVHLA